MIKILIVEDDSDKLRRITAALGTLDGFDVDQVIHVSDVNAAKTQLLSTRFEVVILDIALPNRIDQVVRRDGGLLLLDELNNRSRYKTPGHVIGITGYGDVYESAAERFSQELLTLIKYDSLSDEWAQRLQRRIKGIMLSAADRDADLPDYQCYLAVVCALEAPELESVLRVGWQWSPLTIPGDDTRYYRAEVQRSKDRVVLYAAAASRMGMPAAAILSMKMISIFRPRYLAMAGITAAVRGKANLGDIVVADPSWDYGNGKWATQGFAAAPHQIGLSASTRTRIRAMAADELVLAKIRASWPADKPEHVLAMRVGPVASGAAVLADGSVTARVLDQHRNLIGIEMETYGVYAAAEESLVPRPAAFSLKSVVDFADGEKNDKYQKYAAHTSAHALKYLVEDWL